MKGRKNLIWKVLSFLLVIGIVLMILKDQVPVRISEDTQTIEEKTLAASSLNNWKNRVYSYGSHLGKAGEGMRWLFYDTKGVYKNLYCVQSGNSHDDTYYDFDIYDVSDDQQIIDKFFDKDISKYNHFVWILENMYLVNMSGTDKQYMENQLLAKLEKYDPNVRTYWDNMVSELDEVYRNIGSSNGTDSVSFLLYKKGNSTGTYHTFRGRENFVEVIQNYMLMSYVKQKDGKFGSKPIDSSGNLTINLQSFIYNGNKSYKKYGDFNTNSNSVKFAKALLRYLEEGYTGANTDKYDNFYSNGYVRTYINHSEATYDSENGRIGPFYNYNPYGFTVNVSGVTYGASNINYTVSKNLSKNANGDEFYVLINNSELDGSNTLKVDFNFDFGEVPNTTLLVPSGKTNANKPQLLADAERTHKAKNDSWSQPVENAHPDIALKKYIYAVNGVKVENRLKEIDLTRLKNNETPHTAEYIMNKTPVKVEIGDTVTYAIQLFNEGDVAGTASEITDYLPVWLTFQRAYCDGYDDIQNQGTKSTVKLSNPLQNIPAYSSEDTEQSFREKSQIIYIDCLVDSPVMEEPYVYTNVSEITGYRFERGSDIDSSQTNWSIGTDTRNSPQWQSYTNNHNDWLDNDFHDFEGQEDDDDFDKIIVEQIDIALTKRIEGKLNGDGTETYLVPEGTTIDKARIEISGFDEVKNGTADDLRYNMNKKEALVERGDSLISVITVYNEGHVNGLVKEITDYLPSGLTYNEEKTRELNESNISFLYDNNSRYLTISINDGNGVELRNIDEFTNDCDKFEIKIVTDVNNSANGRIYNSAAITNYGYVGVGGNYYEAEIPGVDKDSYEMGSEYVKSAHPSNYENYENDGSDFTQFDKNYIQVQDDDDVDCVVVNYNPELDLALRKYIYNIEKYYKTDSGSNHVDTYNDRIPEINSDSLAALEYATNGEKTAEYYHNKVKIFVEKGDLVTYRIRVYNEGARNDYDGRATQITDYLPDGLEFVALEDGNDSGWSANTDGNKVILNYSGDKILPIDSIKKLAEISEDAESNDDEHKYFQEVGLICRVTADPVDNEGKVITNRAAITAHEAYEYNVLKPDVPDRDSQPEELNPRLDEWYENTVINEGTPELYYPGEQDDDDFDTICVSGYNIKLVKSDGTNNLPGVDLKVYKYRSVSEPAQDFDKIELSNLEESVKNNGEGVYTTSVPVTSIERDVYIIKEIKSPDGYYNPFEGKYIKVIFEGNGASVTPVYQYRYMYTFTYYGIYEDNNDDDYTNDRMLPNDFRSSNNIYKYVSFEGLGNDFTLTIKNDEVKPYGEYGIKLAKYGTDGNQIEGVQFNASGKFNGGSSVAIPNDNNLLESPATGFVNVIPDSYTTGYVTIESESYDTPDEITISEAGIKDGARDADGNLINKKYYLGLKDKEIKIKINKNYEQVADNVRYFVESIEVTIDGETITGEYTDEETGSKVLVQKIPVTPSQTIIEVNIWNPTLEGNYNLKVGKKSAENNEYIGKSDDGYQVSDDDYLPGAIFTVKQFLNTSASSLNELYEDEYTAINDNVVSLEDEPTQVEFNGESKIDITDATQSDVYIIEETMQPDGYILNGSKFYLEVVKEVDKDNKKFRISHVDVYMVWAAGQASQIYVGTLNDYPHNGHEGESHLWGGIYNSFYFRVDIDKDTNEIIFVVGNPTVKKEGDYSIKLKKTGTDGVQLGGVLFDSTGYFNEVSYDIPKTGSQIKTEATADVEIIPDTLKEDSGVIKITPEKYTTADYFTLTEKGLATDAKDANGNAVDGKYYLGLKDKEIKVTVNKDVNTSNKNKEVYYVKSLDLTVDGKKDNVTGSGYSWTYEDPNTHAKVTISYEGKTINVEVTNPTITKDGTYNINIIKYKKGSNTPVKGVTFSAGGRIDGVASVKLDDVTTSDEGPVSVIENVPMSETYNGMVDTYSLKEESVGDNNDIVGLTGPIELTVKKTIDKTDTTHWIFKVDEIWLKVNGEDVEQKSKTESVVELEDGTKVIVEYKDSSKTIEITVTDPVKEGSFDINLIKYKDYDEDGDGSNDPLEGALFTVTVNDGTKDIKTVENQPTNSEGKIPTISGIGIEKEGIEYTITVTETKAPEGYIGIGKPVTFTATSKSDGDKYVLDTEKQPEITNKYIQAEVKAGEILIEAENRVEPEIHKGVKTVENQDSGYDKNEIQKWVINTTVPKGIGDYTEYTVTDTIDPDKTNNDEKRVAFIDEDHPENNVVVKYKGTDTVLEKGTHYQVTFDKSTKQLKITFIHETEDESNFVGGRNLTEQTTLEITYNTQFTLDSNGDPIGLNQSIPNQAHLTYNGNGVGENKTKDSEIPEVHTGGLGVFKVDRTVTPEKALEGAKFRLVRTSAEAEAAVAAAQDVALRNDSTAFNNIDWVKKYNEDGTVGDAWEITTDSKGYAYFAGLEFGEDAEKEGADPRNEGVNGAPIYKYNWEDASTTYYLIEVEVPEEYILLNEVAGEIEVKKDAFTVKDLTKYHKVGNDEVIPEGEYRVQIVKYGRYQEEGQDKELHAIEGVVFSAKRTVNGEAEENLGKLDSTDTNGKTYVGDTVTIERTKVDTPDTYTITEESIPADSEYYVGLNKPINLTITKKSEKNEDKTKWINSVTGISMSIEGETVTEVEAGKKYTAIVTKDGQELEITAELVEEDDGQLIKLTVENPHKTGKFPLNIVKTIKGTNPVQPLPGAGFKVSIKDGNNYVKDKNGNEINGTKEYFTDGSGNIVIDDIDIRRPDITYDVEVEETTVPAGYIGIGNKITYSVVSVVDGDKLSLEGEENIVVTNDVEVDVKDGEIWNYVENKPEPEIHKGVKTVENQDSGYDGDEIQEWVINTTVPAGIGDYTKYVVTDTIDPDKAVEDKRIEFLGLGTVHVKIKGTDNELVQNNDYVATFNDKTKELTVTFIDGEFKKGQELPEDSTIEITYNTKFRLDDFGHIIGLNQSIPNQAHLTFNGNGKEEKTKDSEIPEVHTGGVGVFKYEDVNKNGKYDDGEPALENAHFKIVRDEEEAKKAVEAVLNDDEETLNTIKFVKVRDAEGKETEKDVELITGKDGSAEYEGLEFGEDAMNKVEATKHKDTGANVYVYDWSVAETKYYLVETEAPEEYYPLDFADEFVVSINSFEVKDLTTYYKEANKKKVYDLSLRKFITHVKGEDVDKEVTDRIPRVTLTDEFKDKENDEVTTAIYEHTKEPVVVQQGNVVTYTIRVYNEGPEDAYASIVKDDIPDGVEFIQYTEGDGSVNDTYRWKLVDENDNPVTDVSKAKYIITDYLSKEQGEDNLLKAFDSDTMKELDYRDLKVQFKVTEPNTSERILTNYAQISEMTNSDGKIVEDRDSTPNKWIEGEDDQDIEHIRLLYFDLALRKWVTKAIVIQDGKETVFETGHKAEDDPEDVVKVDLKKSKLNSVVVKFEYKIRVTNEGRIGGWADEITDHIPDGLRFEQADNSMWTVVDEKTIKTDALKDTYLEPGESAEIPVILTWENAGDNLGIKVNIAEISKDRNEYGVKDIDSTPGNYKWGEDDIDDAPVMLAVKTGNAVLGYSILGLVVVSIIAVGVKAVKKVRNE